MTKLNVIVRSEANWTEDGYHWVAVFPDDPVSKPGRFSYVPFEIRKGELKVGTFGEMTLSWYYDGTKYVNPIVLDSYGVYDALREWFKDEPVKLVFKSKLYFGRGTIRH